MVISSSDDDDDTTTRNITIDISGDNNRPVINNMEITSITSDEDDDPTYPPTYGARRDPPRLPSPIPASRGDITMELESLKVRERSIQAEKERLLRLQRKGKGKSTKGGKRTPLDDRLAAMQRNGAVLGGILREQAATFSGAAAAASTPRPDPVPSTSRGLPQPSNIENGNNSVPVDGSYQAPVVDTNEDDDNDTNQMVGSRSTCTPTQTTRRNCPRQHSATSTLRQ